MYTGCVKFGCDDKEGVAVITQLKEMVNNIVACSHTRETAGDFERF